MDSSLTASSSCRPLIFAFARRRYLRNHNNNTIKATESTATGAPTAAPMFVLFDFGTDVTVATGVPGEVVEVEVRRESGEGEEEADEAEEDEEEEEAPASDDSEAIITERSV